MKMKKDDVSKTGPVDAVYSGIKTILEEARSTAYRAVNSAMVQAYWNVGRLVIEEEQRGKTRAEYGIYLIKELSGSWRDRSIHFIMTGFYQAKTKSLLLMKLTETPCLQNPKT